jgi:hypothetical protein
VTAPGHPGRVTCALRGHGTHTTLRDRVTSWCGRNVGDEFAFTDVTHALLRAHGHGRRTLCPRCGDAIARALERALHDEKQPTTASTPAATIVHHAVYGRTHCGLTDGLERIGWDWTTVTCVSCLQNRPTEPRS